MEVRRSNASVKELTQKLLKLISNISYLNTLLVYLNKLLYCSFTIQISFLPLFGNFPAKG